MKTDELIQEAGDLRSALEKRFREELSPGQWAQVQMYGYLTLLPVTLGITDAAAAENVPLGVRLAPQYRAEIREMLEVTRSLLA